MKGAAPLEMPKTRVWRGMNCQVRLLSTSQRGGNNLKGFHDFYLKAKALTVLYVPNPHNSGAPQMPKTRIWQGMHWQVTY